MSAPSVELGVLAWPLASATDALLALTRAARLPMPSLTRQAIAPPAEIAHDPVRRSDWLRELGKWLGLDVVETQETYPRVRAMFARCAPALLLITHEGTPRLLAIGSSGARHVWVLAPSGERVRIPLDRLRTLVLTDLETPLVPEIEVLLSAAAIPGTRLPRARSALLADRLANTAVAGCWLVRPSPRLTLPSALRMLRAPRRLACLLALYVAHYALLGWSWEAVARGALTGQRDEGWLWAWLLALLSAAPLQALLAARSTGLVLDVGGWLRTRMLEGMLGRRAEAARGEGSGALIGRVIEAGNLESLGLTVALSASFAMIDLPVAALLLYRAGGLLALSSYGLALALLGLCAYRYLRQRQCWTRERLTITHDLIERMVGHKTAVVQAPQHELRELTDRRLATYIARSRDFDGMAVALGLLPRLWMLVAFFCLLSSPTQQEPATLAFALAGLFVGMRTLSALALGLSQLSAARIAWTGVRSLFEGELAPPGADPSLVAAARSADTPRTLEACALTVSYADRARCLLADADLTIRAGDRLLLEGPSGAGKSTLAEVLAGARPPTSGTLTVEALDLATLGRAGWTRRITLAPQFHDNHVVEGTLAFNLLLDRSWPPRPSDLTDAEEVCRELGLGPLLDTMPAGMQQVVGENGWQLSHGELTRVYAARAILSDADLVILDESIAALDPKTAEAVLACARRRTRALLLIAHP